MSTHIDPIRTIGWYSDNGGDGRSGERLYTYWNGVTWSARAHESWSADDDGRQALVPSFVAPSNPMPVGRHEYALPQGPCADVLNSMRESLLAMDARVRALENRPDVSRQINAVMESVEEIRSGLFAAAGGNQ